MKDVEWRDAETIRGAQPRLRAEPRVGPLRGFRVIRLRMPVVPAAVLVAGTDGRRWTSCGRNTGTGGRFDKEVLRHAV